MTELTQAAAEMASPALIEIPDPAGLELETVDLPRDAFFYPTQDVPAKEAVGRVAAEQITPYPPGIPVVVPGERINAAVIDRRVERRDCHVLDERRIR